MSTKISSIIAIAAALAATALNGTAAESAAPTNNPSTATSTPAPAAPESRLSAESTVDFLTSYVDDNGALVSDASNARGELTVSDASGVYLTVTRYQGLASTSKAGNFANETRYFAGYSGEIAKFSLDAGIGYYDYYGKTDDLKTYYVEVGRTFEKGGKWTPSILHEAYLTRSDAGYSDGHRTFFALAYEAGGDVLSIELKASAMRETGFDSPSNWTRELAATVGYKVSEHVTVRAGVRRLVPSHIGDGQDRRTVGSLGVKLEW